MTLDQIKMLIVIGMAAALLALAGYFVYDYNSTKTKNEELKVSLVLLTKSIETQNAGIEELKKLSDLQETRIKDAIKKQGQIQDQYSKEIIMIARQPVPKDCAGAMQWLSKSKEDLKWKK